MDYASRYLEQFADLKLVKEQRVAYRDSENVDSMFVVCRVEDSG